MPRELECLILSSPSDGLGETPAVLWDCRNFDPRSPKLDFWHGRPYGTLKPCPGEQWNRFVFEGAAVPLKIFFDVERGGRFYTMRDNNMHLLAMAELVVNQHDAIFFELRVGPMVDAGLMILGLLGIGFLKSVT